MEYDRTEYNQMLQTKRLNDFGQSSRKEWFEQSNKLVQNRIKWFRQSDLYKAL